MAWGAQLDRHSTVTLDAQSLGFGGWMTEPVVADRAQTVGQNVAQIVEGVGQVYPLASSQVLALGATTQS